MYKFFYVYMYIYFFFFFNDTATTEIYTLSLHDALPIFEQMFTKANGNFVGVAAANDGLGGAVASVLKREGASDDIPTTGQDATDEGLQRVLLGTQCVTVYKAIKKEADAAANLAVALAKGDTAGADSQATGSVKDTETKQDVKSVLLEPQAIFPENVKD